MLDEKRAMHDSTRLESTAQYGGRLTDLEKRYKNSVSAAKHKKANWNIPQQKKDDSKGPPRNKPFLDLRTLINVKYLQILYFGLLYLC